jgi:hypothetical protein
MTVRKDDVDRARIVVTVPMRPSRFESALAEINDSGVLIETMDTFLHLSRRAADHLVVVSPFLDADGLEWVSSLFEATRAPERVLICRHYDQVTSPHSRRLSAAGVAPPRPSTPRSSSPIKLRPMSVPLTSCDHPRSCRSNAGFFWRDKP